MKKSMLTVLLAVLLSTTLMGCTSNITSEDNKVVKDLQVQNFEDAYEDQLLEKLREDSRSLIGDVYELMEQEKQSGKYDNDMGLLVDYEIVSYLYNNL